MQGLPWWWSDRISLPMQETRVQSLGRKIPWSRTWQSIPLFFLGQSKESWTWLSNWACTHAFCARHYASCLGCQELTKYGTWLQGVQLRFSRLKRKLVATLGTSIFVTLKSSSRLIIIIGIALLWGLKIFFLDTSRLPFGLSTHNLTPLSILHPDAKSLKCPFHCASFLLRILSGSHLSSG